MTIKNKSVIKISLIIGVGIILTLFLLFVFNKNKVIIPTSKTIKDEYEILVDVEESILYLFKNKELIKTYSCSGGKWSTPSPIGTWKIIEKSTWGEGFGREMDGLKCSVG